MFFPERDWKILSRLRPLALEQLCRRILEGARNLIAEAQEGESHRACLAPYDSIHEQNDIVAECFDRWSRSRALGLLTLWRRHGII